MIEEHSTLSSVIVPLIEKQPSPALSKMLLDDASRRLIYTERVYIVYIMKSFLIIVMTTVCFRKHSNTLVMAGSV